MRTLHEALLRLIVSAETRAAREGLTQLDNKVKETAANVKAASAEVDSASTAITGLGSSANSIKGALASLGGGLALGAAIGGITLLTGAVVDYVKELIAAHKEQEALNSILPEGGKKAAGAAEDIFRLQSEVALYKKGLIDSKTVTDDFNESIGKTAGKLQDVADVEKFLNEKAEAYIQFTLLKASANIAFAKAAESAELAQEALLKQNKDFSNLRDKISVNPLVGESKAGDEAFENAIIQRQSERRKKAIDDAIKAQEDFKKVGDQLNQQAAELSKKFNFNFNQHDDNKDKIIDETQKRIQILKETKQVLDSLISTKDVPLFKKEQGTSKLDLDILNTQIKKVAEDAKNDPANKDAFNQLGAALKKVLAAKLAEPDLHTRIIFNLDDPSKGLDQELDKVGSEIAKKFKTLSTKEPKIEFTPEIELSNKTQAELDKLAKTFGEGFKQAVVSGIESAAQGIGEAIGKGGGLSKILSALGNTLAGFLKEIGKLYIESGIRILFAKKTFEKFIIAQPELAIAAGIALEILAGALESKINATKFASGGIVTGPTLGLVGEAGPEVIFPLSQLNRFVKKVQGNQEQRLTGNVIVKGTDLQIALARTQKNQSLV